MGKRGRGGAEKTEGPAFASPSDQSFALQGRDVRGDFHRDGDDLGLGLGPLHVFVLREGLLNGLTIGCYHPVGSLVDPTTPAQMQMVCQNVGSYRLWRKPARGGGLRRFLQIEF
jgi:hypothetical protein